MHGATLWIHPSNPLGIGAVYLRNWCRLLDHVFVHQVKGYRGKSSDSILIQENKRRWHVLDDGMSLVGIHLVAVVAIKPECADSYGMHVLAGTNEQPRSVEEVNERRKSTCFIDTKA